MGMTRAFHAGSTGSNPVRGTADNTRVEPHFGRAGVASSGGAGHVAPTLAEKSLHEPSHSHASRALLLAGVFLIALLGWTAAADDASAVVPAPRGVTVKHRVADAHQREMIGRVLAECRRLGVPAKVRVAAVATMTQESTARNLRGGHGSSVGLFQIIDLHGPVSVRRNPEWAARWFCSRAKNVNKHRPGLSIAGLSQAVQRSAHPRAYALWAREAVRTQRVVVQQVGCGS